MEENVRTAFDAHPKPVRAGLLALRKLILDTARKTPGVGPITEDLRWGQPSFLTQTTGSGSTIRIDCLRDEPDKFAMFFNCQTGLIDQFRAIYGDQLAIVGNRAIEFHVGDPLPEEELSHCIALALTHHARKKARKKPAARN